METTNRHVLSEYVSPEYQERLDNLSELLRCHRAEIEYEGAVDSFEQVFLPLAYFKQKATEVQ